MNVGTFVRITKGVLLAVLAPAMAGGFAGCGSNTSGPEGSGIPEETTFDPALGVDLAQMTRLGSGLYIQDLVVGTGEEASIGDQIVVAYSGWLSDGTLFDRRTAAQGGIDFPLLPGNLIDGWVQGIPGMRVGGQRRLVIPSTLGYGSRGQGPIPPNSVLVFDVELLDIL